jgi:hypothetical protein
MRRRGQGGRDMKLVGKLVGPEEEIDGQKIMAVYLTDQGCVICVDQEFIDEVFRKTPAKQQHGFIEAVGEMVRNSLLDLMRPAGGRTQ